MKCVEQVIVKCSENIKYFNVLGELPTPPIQVPFPLQQTPDWVAGVNIVTFAKIEVYNHREGPYTGAFSWLKAPTGAFTFKALLRHYAKWVLTHGK